MAFAEGRVSPITIRMKYLTKGEGGEGRVLDELIILNNLCLQRKVPCHGSKIVNL